MRELRPCPICGSTVVIQKIEPRLYRPTRNHPYSVVCYNCDLMFGYDVDYGGIFDTEEEAAEAWNRSERNGEWLLDNRPGGGFWVCSCCKFPSEAFAADKLYKFCPNCGAHMVTEEEI